MGRQLFPGSLSAPTSQKNRKEGPGQAQCEPCCGACALHILCGKPAASHPLSNPQPPSRSLISSELVLVAIATCWASCARPAVRGGVGHGPASHRSGESSSVGVTGCWDPYTLLQGARDTLGCLLLN